MRLWSESYNRYKEFVISLISYRVYTVIETPIAAVSRESILTAEGVNFSMDRSICRIGVFYDGSYFAYAQTHFYNERNMGWLSFQPFHHLVENFLREQEQGYSIYRVVYAGWYQGLFHANQSDEHHLRRERNRHHDLMHAGIEPKYIPMSQSQGEKGVDVAVAIDALQIGMEGKIDIAVLITGDGDLIPLARALMKHGVRVAAIYFEYESDRSKSFANERLLTACNYCLNVNDLETDRRYQGVFRGLFRPKDKSEAVQVS